MSEIHLGFVHISLGNFPNFIMNDNIKFSIVIPTYNEEKDIGRTLTHLVALDWPNFDIVIVDDSTDSTPAIVSTFHDERIRLIHPSKREGRCAARNIGILESSGDVVVILNADVQLPRDFLRLISCHYENGADYVLVRSVVDNIDDLFARYIECVGIYQFYGRDPNALEWTEGFSCRRELALRAGLFPTGFVLPLCAGEDGAFGEQLRKLNARKVVDLSISCTHTAPATFGEYWHIRRGRGQGSPQVRRFLQNWGLSRIAIRATFRLTLNILMFTTIMPMLLRNMKYAQYSSRGLLDALPFCYAWFLEQAAFSVGEYSSLYQIFTAENRKIP